MRRDQDAKAKIGAIVRGAIAKRDLTAVLAGVALGDKPFLIEAWCESMTGRAGMALREAALRRYSDSPSAFKRRQIGGTMRKFGVALAVAAAMLVAGSPSWNAEATSAVKSGTLPAMVKKFSLIEKAACGGWGKHCPPGYTWRCGPYRCACRPC